MESILQNAVLSAQKAEVAFSKFITANDTGTTGGHQSGYHIHKNAWSLFFDSPGEKGTKRDVWITIKWQNEFEIEKQKDGQRGYMKIPIAVWSRLFLDLEPFLTERDADGVPIITFFHKQFNEVLRERYKLPNPSIQN